MEERTSFPLQWDKLAAAVAYLSEKSRNDDNFSETKLVKLLYYADSAAYLRTGKPITGATYIHMPHGPYPHDWKETKRRLEDDKSITILEENIPNGQKRRRPIAGVAATTDALTKQEQRFLDEQLRRFHDFNARQIEDYSHDELAWRITAQGEAIPYGLLGFRVPGSDTDEVRQRAQRLADSIRERGYRIAHDVTPR